MAERGPRFSRRRLLAACGTMPLGGCNTTLGRSDDPPEWPTVQRDPGHTGYVPDADPPRRGLVVGWDVETDQDDLLYHPPVFAGGTLFAASSTVVYAIDSEEGSVRWTRRRTTTADGQRSRFGVGEVACDANRAFVAWQASGENDRLTAYDAETGESKWELGSAATVGAILPVGDTLYAIASTPEGRQLLSLDPRHGEVRWRSRVDAAGDPPLAYADGTLFSGAYRDVEGSFTGRWHVRAFDAENGDRRWSREVKGYEVGARSDAERLFGVGGGGAPNLTVADGRVYFGTGPAELFALDAADGSELWSYGLEAGRTDTGHAPVVDEDTVYLANLSTVTALDATTGEERWTYDDARIPFRSHPQRYPILVGKTLLVPEQLTWLALDANTGEEAYRHGRYDDGLVGIAPVVVGGVLYAAVGDSVYAVGESW